ncbi:MAG: hypothetical protein RRY99_11855, partial [Flavobacterium sp.]
ASYWLLASNATMILKRLTLHSDKKKAHYKEYPCTLIVEKIALSKIGKINALLFNKFCTSVISYSHKKTPQTNTLECYKFLFAHTHFISSTPVRLHQPEAK